MKTKKKKSRINLRVGQEAAQRYLAVTAHCCNAAKWSALVKRCIDIGLHSESERHSLDAIRLLSSMILPQDPVKFLQVIQTGDGSPSTLADLRARHSELQAMRSTAASLVMQSATDVKDVTVTDIQEESEDGSGDQTQADQRRAIS